MPAGQLQYVPGNPVQLLNPTGPGSDNPPTLIENLAADPATQLPNTFSIDLSWQPFQQIASVFGVPPGVQPAPTPLPGGNQNIYTLAVGATYAWPSDQPLFARITPLQNPNGNSAPVWIQPAGIGQSSPYTISNVNPLPLPTSIDSAGLGGSPSTPLYVVSQATTALTPQSELVVPNPAIGGSDYFILPVAGRVVMYRGSLVCGIETNERMLYFTVVFGPTGVMQYPFIIGQTTASCGFAGALGIQNGILGQIMNFPLPNIFLPAGSKIGISVIGINPDDYLDELDFTISAA